MTSTLYNGIMANTNTKNANGSASNRGSQALTLIRTKPFIAGLWKFRNTVPIATLITLAKNWAKSDPGYIQLFIRQVEHNENGIDFIYQPHIQIPLGDYIKNTSQELKSDFGNDLTGWDVATSLWIMN